VSASGVGRSAGRGDRDLDRRSVLRASDPTVRRGEDRSDPANSHPLPMDVGKLCWKSRSKVLAPRSVRIRRAALGWDRVRGRGEGIKGGCKMIDRQSLGGESTRQVMPIEEIGLDDQGYLFVRPLTAAADEFTYIYRAAMGIQWNTQSRALHAYEPARWVATDLYKQIIAAVYSEYGVQLTVTPGTRWSRIPADVRKWIQALDLDTTAG
jgi:hypothetical protein